MSSPTVRSLALLRSTGWTVQVVEHWNAFSKRRVDLFGCIDILAVKAGAGCLGVQACVVGDQSKRMKKALAEPRLRAWLEAGNHFEVWGWGKHGKEGARKLWTVTRRPVTLDADADLVV